MSKTYPENWISEQDLEAIGDSEGIFELPSRVMVYCKRHPQTSKLTREYSILRHLAQQNQATPSKVALHEGEHSVVLVTEFVGEPLPREGFRDPATLYEILWALRGIWSCGIIHCDIKPEHIRVSDQGIRIIDFDLAYNTRQVYQLGCYRGTVPFSAVSALRGLTPSPSTDLESLFYACASCVRAELLPWFDDSWACIMDADSDSHILDQLPELTAQRIQWLNTDQSPLVSSLLRMSQCTQTDSEAAACEEFAVIMVKELSRSSTALDFTELKRAVINFFTAKSIESPHQVWMNQRQAKMEELQAKHQEKMKELDRQIQELQTKNQAKMKELDQIQEIQTDRKLQNEKPVLDN